LLGSASQKNLKCNGRVAAHARFDSNAGISVPSLDNFLARFRPVRKPKNAG
jgi:hypothetical protein